jgi:hypothetical protein
MQFFKFSFFLFFVITHVFAVENLSHISDCLNSSFDIEIEHGVQPFGLLKKSLSFEKKNCVVEVISTSYFVLKKHWLVDVCRDPVHLKKGKNPFEVFKKVLKCDSRKGKRSPFCQESTELKTLIQDDGLLFAQGEKEFLSSDHGKAYCVYKLFEDYFSNDLVFNRHAPIKMEEEKIDQENKEPITFEPTPISEPTQVPEETNSATF